MFAEVGKIQPVGHCTTAIPTPLSIAYGSIYAAVAWLSSCDQNSLESWKRFLQKTFADLELYSRSEASRVYMGRSGLESHCETKQQVSG